MFIKDKQIEELKPYIQNIDEIIALDDVQELLDSIDDVLLIIYLPIMMSLIKTA